MAELVQKTVLVSLATWDEWTARAIVAGSKNAVLESLFWPSLDKVIEIQRGVNETARVIEEHVDRSSSIPERERRAPETAEAGSGGVPIKEIKVEYD